MGDLDNNQRCHGSCNAGPLRPTGLARDLSVLTRPQTFCNTNHHLTQKETQALVGQPAQVNCLRLEETGFISTTLTFDNDLRDAYRAVATPWEAGHSRILNYWVKYPVVTKQMFDLQNYLMDSLPVLDDANLVVGYCNIEKTDNIYAALYDVDGTLVSRQLIGNRPIESDGIGNFIAETIATFGVGLLRGAASAIIARSGSALTQAAIVVARGISAQAHREVLLFFRAIRARGIVDTFVRAGKKVIVNIGGEAGKEEMAMFGEHIALNHQVRMSAGSRVVPNLVKEPGENIGRVFKPNSVDKVVSRKVDHTFDTDKVAEGAHKVLKPGGELNMNVFPDGPPGGFSPFADRFVKSLVKAGFDPAKIKNIGNVQFIAVK